ncbi:ABC transporter ATP-binding protein [Pontibacillus halophilus JSM 076056 = DSM 19796]|uniref:ABC transporter ATP-binding protein n=1 Tax=Pontibacillus halophilus JSM 076056 = DSM 19796 TaxID=1385510 RepID=A0A0A5GP18_9BACI|nr:thiol reductant ABC exporter subunit CydC [Pontibacillus halophilus]KGX93734.1 ABC transporter ATP-binding protein [Pontibacillus halophilus JSM 076056 = DSM 19796]
MKDLSQIVKLVLTEKRDVYLSIVFGALAGLSAAGLFAASGYLISKAALTTPLYALMVVIALLKLLGFFRAFARYGERIVSHRATFSIISRLRVSFYEKLEPLAPKVLHKYRSGDLLARIVGDVETLQNFFLRVFYPPIVLAIVFLSTILFTLFFSYYVSLVLLVGLLLTSVVIPVFFASKQRKVESRIRERRGKLSTEVTEMLYGHRDLKIYQKLDEKERELERFSNSYQDEQDRQGLEMMANQSTNSFVSFLVSWTVLVVAAYQVTQGQLDGIFLAMLVMLSLTAFENATPMALVPTHLEESRRASRRLYSVVEGQNTKDGETSIEEGPLAFGVERGTLYFENDARPALREVEVHLPKGSKTAIVGPSGSGKSTLLQVLLGVYVLRDGNVTVNHHPFSRIQKESLWQQMNVVLQENHFFYGNIRDNLLVADEATSDDALQAALRDVELGHFRLEDPVYERGENLSDGEKQRLAIARAMLKGAGTWMLDEPTSSLDALTEQSVYRRLFELAKEDTLVLISHRLAGLEQMDQIIVMENGAIIEQGTFTELMDKRGYFYEMKQIEKSVMI